jgi:hypothetical protein
MKRFWQIGILILLTQACGVYSFTGASIDPEVKTVSVAYIENQATLVNPNLSQTMTEKLKDFFVIQTNLDIVRRNGDLQFEGVITNYSVRPINIQSGDVAAENRLTVTVRMIFTNTVDDEKSFEHSFTRFADFDGNQNLKTVEEELVDQITNELVEDIFNKAVVNW